MLGMSASVERCQEGRPKFLGQYKVYLFSILLDRVTDEKHGAVSHS